MLKQLTQLPTLQNFLQIKFRIEVRAGPIPKVVAVNAAKKLKATWVVLDRLVKCSRSSYDDKLETENSNIGIFVR